MVQGSGSSSFMARQPSVPSSGRLRSLRYRITRNGDARCSKSFCFFLVAPLSYALHETLPGSALMASTTYGLVRHVSVPTLGHMMDSCSFRVRQQMSRSHGNTTWTEAPSVGGLLCCVYLC